MNGGICTTPSLQLVHSYPPSFWPLVVVECLRRQHLHCSYLSSSLRLTHNRYWVCFQGNKLSNSLVQILWVEQGALVCKAKQPLLEGDNLKMNLVWVEHPAWGIQQWHMQLPGLCFGAYTHAHRRYPLILRSG